MTVRARQPRKDGQATRAAILGAARALFVELGYEGATVRAIAGRAGCNAALVTRYFGGKAALFAVLAREGPIGEAARHPVLDLPFRSWGHALVRRQIQITGRASRDQLQDQLLMLLRSSATPSGSRMLTDFLARDDTQLIPELDGPDAALRSALLRAQLVGLTMLRDIARLPALRQADAETVASYLGPALQQLLQVPGAQPP